jgi:hypothetical protein
MIIDLSLFTALTDAELEAIACAAQQYSDFVGLSVVLNTESLGL